MYPTVGATAGAVGGAAALPVTGANHWVWIAVAGFTLLTGGFAALRLIPKLRRNPTN